MYEPANHPRAWKRLNVLDMSKTSSLLKVKYSCGSIELKVENCCFSGIKRICTRGRNWFALHSSNLSWTPYYISPSWI